MQYQHLVFEEFARRMQPMVDPFIFNSSPNVDPSIIAEFAHTVYRFGHSMLTGTVDRLDNNLNLLNGDLDQNTLLASFLNPTGYIQSGATVAEINANFIRGLSRDVGNAMDEFIVTDVRSNLLGLPLDLAALNIARGRDTGIPSLNETRAQLYNDTGLADLKPYESWFDFALNIKNPASVINFIAAYGTHASLTAPGLTTAQMREAATLLVMGDGNNADGVTIRGVTYSNADRVDFLNGSGIYTGTVNPANANDLGGLGGLNDIDLWIGGLAEKNPEFGGMLGTTFNFVFEYQMEALQNGDRLYYLTRTQGTNFLNQLEPNTFSDLVMRNTELGGDYATHVNGALFTTPDHIIELDRGIAQTDYNGVADGRDPEWDGSNPVVEAILGPKVVRDYTGATTVQAPATNLPLPVISNGSFEQDALVTGQPGVIADAILGNYTLTAPTGWSIAGGEGGMFAPAPTVTDPGGHAGSNVVWLRSGATLSKNTGVTLVQGATYSVSFKVGDRTDLAWPGGTARLMASDGINPAVVLATLSLAAPANGLWSNVLLTTGSIANIHNGYTLYFEVQQGDGSSNQILVDDVSIAANYSGATVTHDVGGYLRVQGGEHYVLGGTEGNDTIYGDSGIDTLWGDGGNDYLNGMTESDDVFGGAGDDIIEDPFGDDVLRGNEGNDVITSARGADLMFGDQGQDYILVGQDAGEVFAGTDSDFVLGGNGKDFLLGNEGDDWIEGGGGFDTLAGDNSELFFNSPIIGHDVMFGQGDETDYDAESGDDIMGSGPSIFRYEGMFGFDWGIAKNDVSGVNFDLQIPIFTTIPNDVLRDRFDQVEALSGWKFEDHLDGDDRGHSGGSSSPDSTPVELFIDHTLDAAGIARIAGLGNLLSGNGPAVTSFKNGNVLIGGDGNDFLRGRGGFDTIDGDAWLNVRIKIVVGGVTYSAESMSTDMAFAGQYAGKVYNVYTSSDSAADPTHIAGAPNFDSPAFGGRSLNSLMLDRTINPGQLSIVREILYDNTDVTGANKNIDTAIFQGGNLEYEIEGSTVQYGADGVATGRTGVISDVNNDGFITVRDLDDGTIAAPGRVGGLTVSRGALTDDTDKLVNIERLQFADETLTVGASNNTLATGTVTISDPTPFDHDVNPATPGVISPIVGQVLTATLSNLVDPDGVPIDPATGMPIGLTFEWQTTEAGNDGGWATITTGLTYTVRPVDPSHVLRAVAVFKDGAGVTERITSGQTDNVTAPFSVNENTTSGTVIAPVPFSLDYDPLGFGGTGVTDGDVVQLTHVMAPGQDAGGRFTIVNTAISGPPVYQLAVANGALLDYEALQSPVDNQYQIVIHTYTDTIANGGVLMAARQFTVMINDVVDAALVNSPATGQALISDLTPTEGQVITASTLGINDANGLPGTFNYQWQYSEDGGTTWINTGTNNASFTPSNARVNDILRVVVSYTDLQGFAEAVTSASSSPVGDFATAFGGALNGTAWDDNLLALGGNTTINGNAGSDIINGGSPIIFVGGGNDTLSGGAGNDTINGNGGTDAINGGADNDTINGGAGNDTITQRSTDGRDIVDGAGGTDTYQLIGVVGAEVFRIYTRAAALTGPDAITGLTAAMLNSNTEIVITRTTGGAVTAASIIAELDSIEEINVNTLGVTANNGNGGLDGGSTGGPPNGDTVQIIGNFGTSTNPITSLNFSTITIDGNAGDDTVDISALTSAHRIVFKSNGGNDTIIGNLRPQDLIELPDGATAADYTTTTDANGVSTMTNGTHSVTFTATSGSPQVGNEDEDDHDDDDYDHDHDDHHNDEDDEDEDEDCGPDGEEQDDDAPAPAHAGPFLGTPQNDVLIGTSGGDLVFGFAGIDHIVTGAGADVVRAGAGNDFGDSQAGNDVIFGDDGDDDLFGGDDDDMIYGGVGEDRLFGQNGNDLLDAGDSDDTVFGGSGNDLIVASLNDGNDTYYGGDMSSDTGSDTLEMGFLTVAAAVDLGTGVGGRGSAVSSQGGTDVLFGIDNVTTGSGNDTITMSNAVNVVNGGQGEDMFIFGSATAAHGDTIRGFETGDKIDLSGIDANTGTAGNDTFVLESGQATTAPGQIVVTHETREDGEYTVVVGNTSGDNAPEFRINIAGNHALTADDFNL